MEAVVDGFNGTLFIYGQTGAGKTYNMMGPAHSVAEEVVQLRGIAPRALQHVFEKLTGLF